MKARAQYEKERDAWEKRKPWIAKYGPALVTWSVAVCTTWVLWALLRAVGAERRLTPIDHPPTCEFCGYNLTGAAADGRCPECGDPVVRSLGPETRPGTRWEHRRKIGRLQAWWACAVGAVRRPNTIGRQIKARSHAADHRIFLAMHLPAGFLIGSVTGIGLLYVTFLHGRPFRQMEREILQFVVPFGGIIGELVVLTMATLSASVVGLFWSLRSGRNLLPRSCRLRPISPGSWWSGPVLPL